MNVGLYSSTFTVRIHAHEKGWLTVNIEFDVVRKIIEEIREGNDEQPN